MGSFRSQPDLEKNTITKQGNGIIYAVSSMCGWRNYMEDAHLSVSPLNDQKNSLFAVFDGHGGAQVAVFVQKHFTNQLESNPNYKKCFYEKALKQTFLKMDQLLMSTKGKLQIQQIQKEMRQKGNAPNYEQQSHAGCTANVCLITPQAIYVANSGDSRAVCSINGQVQELSKDHKPEDTVQLDRIKKAGGQVSFGRVNGNLNLSRALGDLQYKTNSKLSAQQQIITANPDIKKIKNQGIDFIIMGCDGIWQVKKNSQMIKWMKKKMDEKKKIGDILEQLLMQLVSKDNCNSQYGMDNMSSILIKFNQTNQSNNNNKKK